MKVDELMTPNLGVCSPNTSLAEAAMLMWHNDCGVLPVADHQNKILGMITDRDICIGLATRKQSPENVHVQDVMSVDVCSCTPEDKVHTALDLMAKAKVRRLPVLNDEGELCGMLSLNDIILRAEHKKPSGRGKSKLQSVTYEDTMHALKSISTHWTDTGETAKG